MNFNDYRRATLLSEESSYKLALRVVQLEKALKEEEAQDGTNESVR